MEERALRVLEFDQFLQTLKAYTSTEVGQGLALTLHPALDPKEIEDLLTEVTEAEDLLREGSDLPLEGLREVRPLLLRARAEGACFPPAELLWVQSTLVAARRVKKFLYLADRRLERLKKWGGRVPEFRGLEENLASTIGPRGEILDSASPELNRIRREIMKVRSRIRRALENLWSEENLKKIFQDEIITLRNERYVLAVKADFKNALPGIIHDQSQSRATFFIEPFSTVEENNELNLLLKDEKEEERRILLALTAEVREQSGEIAQAVEILGRLDLIMAKARWAREEKGTIPRINNQGKWHVRQARHPLLNSQTAVPIDLFLEREQSTLIITGANTGGKTVALKTLGLLTLMAQCGIPIPAAEGSEVSLVNKIFADIGDEQSLRDNLSTFSAWVQAVAKILTEADPASLVLLDEVGGGTDPSEGAALTMALLDKLRERGSKTVVTTHLQLLKGYGAVHPDVVNVSVEFNRDTLQPTYRLIYGRPGDSYALLMARKWGLPLELVEKAEAYLGEDNQKIGELLQSLDQTQQEMEAKLKAYERMKQEAEELREKASALIEETKREKERVISKAQEETGTLIRQARENLRKVINEFKAKGRTDVHRLQQEIQAEEEKICLSLGSLPVAPRSIPLARPHGKAKEGPLAGSRASIQYEVPNATQQLKLIGLRVEEALPLVDKAIDKAFLAGLPELEVIHGAGTGKLRQAIREYLGEHVLVKSFLPGGADRGGDGVTRVAIAPSPKSAPARGGLARQKVRGVKG